MKWLLIAGLLLSCSNSINKPEKENDKMIIRFYNFLNFTIPAAPGNIEENISLLGSISGEWFGVLTPFVDSPSSSMASSGCDPEGNAKIIQYRTKILGAENMRPGVIDSGSSSLLFVPYFSVRLMRYLDGGTPIATDLFFPIGADGEWIPSGAFYKRLTSTSGYTRPRFTGGALVFDTRNIDPFYRGKPARLVFEMDIECNPVGL